MQITYPTTPAQHFHLLRRQVLRPWRKPLVIMAPKSTLRLPRNTSDLQELTHGSFQRVLDDPHREKLRDVSKIILCSGKIYFDLEEERAQRERWDVAIIRIEQLYPLREKELQNALRAYGAGTPVLWVQEEPENMGAWRYLRAKYCLELPGGHPFRGVARAESASPATGSSASHKLEHRNLMDQAFES